MSVGPPVALCQADTLSSSCCARTEVILSTFAIPFRTSPFQSVCWVVVAVVWTSFVREFYERVYGLNFLEASRLLGIWMSMVMRPRDGPSRINAFCILHLVNRPEAIVVGEGALSKLLAGKVHYFMGFSVTSAATGALAPFRKSHVSLPASAVSSPSLAHMRSSFLFGRICAAHVALKRIIKNVSLMKVYPTCSAILSWVKTTGCALTFFALSSKAVLTKIPPVSARLEIAHSWSHTRSFFPNVLFSIAAKLGRRRMGPFLLVMLYSHAEPSELLLLRTPQTFCHQPLRSQIRGPSSLHHEKMDNARKPILRMSPSSWIGSGATGWETSCPFSTRKSHSDFFQFQTDIFESGSILQSP